MNQNERIEAFKRHLLKLDEAGLAFVDEMLDELTVLKKEVINA